MMNTKDIFILCKGGALRLSAMTLILIVLAPEPVGQTTSRVSLGSGGVQANNSSMSPSLSNDGRYVVFYSEATNLVPGDTNGSQDVFFRDRQTGTTTRVSVGTGGIQADGYSITVGIPANGRYIPINSLATNLVPGDTNAAWDVFVHDRESGQTTRVSVGTGGVQGNSSSFWGSISEDGRYVAFHSLASNLVPGDTNGVWDVFVHDRQTGVTSLVSLTSSGFQSNGDSAFPAISADGHSVVFRGDGSNLVPGDTNGTWDLFVRDLVAGTTERVSVATGGGQGNAFSYLPAISADGRYVAFESDATNLVTPDANGNSFDIYVRDRVAGTTERVSTAWDGTQGTSDSEHASISADGRFVSFQSWASNLVPGDTNLDVDVFLHDRQSGTTTRVSVDPGGAQLANPSYSTYHAVSDDGRYVAFYSGNSFVPGDTNGTTDCFVRDLGATFTTFCHGDGTGSPCPCGNSGQAGHGCENSVGTGGALLGHSGTPVPDALVLQVTGERPTALTIFLQGDTRLVPVAFGDGLRCLGGVLKRLYVKSAVNGQANAPQPTDPSITLRSAALGDQIPPGATRNYMTYYRDSNASFCPAPAGNTFNSSNGISVVW